MIDKLPAIKLTPEQARHFAVGERAWTYPAWSQSHDGMLSTMFQQTGPHPRLHVTFWTMTIDPEGVGALSVYNDNEKKWVAKEIFAPVDPDKELMWDEEEEE
jgi:hypothetical protein